MLYRDSTMIVKMQREMIDDNNTGNNKMPFYTTP